MKKIVYLLMILVCLSACKSKEGMTEEERTLIYNEGKDVSFRVLTIDNVEDSLALRMKSIDVESPENIAKNKDWLYFIERLKLTMVKESGVGISAVQVGIHRNLFLFMRLDKPERPIQVAINPRIVTVSDNVICFKDDGCLSIPAMSGDTFRYPEILVEYYDEKGELVQEWLKGESRGGDFTGVVFQHEFDHLQGVLYIDRLCE